MEGLPYRIAVGGLVLAVGVAALLQGLGTYADLAQRKRFADDVVGVLAAMAGLASTADPGSFTRLAVRIPTGGGLTFDNASNTVRVVAYGEVRNYTVPGKLLWQRNYTAGSYELEVYYGNPPFGPARDYYTIAFA